MAIIDKPSDYFNTKLYTGNGGTLVNTGVGFQPDLVWAKSRTQANSHVWFDVIRTFAGGKEIQSNNTGAEGVSDSAGYGYISAVSSDGFTAQAGTTAGDYTNVSSQNYVAWNWKAGGTASSNTDGSITSNVSANTTSGFSIVSYTGTGSLATVGHGLGVTPKVVMVKNLENATDWGVYNSNLTNANYLLYINLTHAETNQSSNFGTAPTSSFFTVNTNNSTNQSGLNHIAYCFAEKQGYSKFGSYTGNGNADGTFVYTGFKPAFVMSKYTTGGSAGGEGWNMFDNKRDPFNIVDLRLQANSSNAESSSTNHYHDFLSNGFKLRTVDGSANNSGTTYIYMAFAENPFVTSTGVPATAR